MYLFKLSYLEFCSITFVYHLININFILIFMYIISKKKNKLTPLKN